MATVTRNLPINALRSFVLISECGRFTQAGEILGRSQPAISLQIRKLENQLGLTLFERHGHNFKLTSSGQILLDHAQKILTTNDHAVSMLHNQREGDLLRLGLPSEFIPSILPYVLAQFHNRNPNVVLEISCDLSKDLMLGLAQGAYDLVLSLNPNVEKEDEYLIKIDRLVWVSSQQFEYHEHDALSIIFAPEGCIYRARALDVLSKSTKNWKIAYTIKDLSGIQSALQAGLGITVLAESTVSEDMRIMDTGDQLPNLGRVGIDLITASETVNATYLSLVNYIKSTLTDPSVIRHKN